MAKISNYTVPAKTIINPCNSETIDFSGFTHVVVTVTTDNNGGFHVNVHNNNQGVNGIGLTTGTKYIMANSSTFEEYDSPSVFPQEITIVSNTKIIAKGAAPDFTLYSISKLTVNANGDVTAFKDEVRTECK